MAGGVPEPRRARLEDGSPTRPTRPCRLEEPHLPSPVGQARELPFRAGTQTPKQRPRRGLWDSRGLSVSRGPLPARLPVPRGLRVGASHGSELAPRLRPPVLRSARARPGPWAGSRQRGGRMGGAEGWAGVAGEPCLRVPAAGKVDAGDFANRRAQPAPWPGTPVREHRRAMLMPRSCRGRGCGRCISLPGSPRAAESNRWSGLEAWARPQGPAVREDVAFCPPSPGRHRGAGATDYS